MRSERQRQPARPSRLCGAGWRWVAGLAAVIAFSCSCSKSPAPPPTASTNAPAQTYEARGIVRGVDAPAQKLRVHHEEIPGFMPEMTMPLDVKDVRELESLEPGDKIAFRLLVTDADAWVEGVRVLERAPGPPVATNQLPASGEFRLVRDVDPLAVGDLIPDYTFTNELGRAVRLHDFRGRAFAFTFIYTRCPLPTFCPLMSQNFSKAYQLLISNAAGPTNWHLCSISFDVAYDTPEILKAYAARYHPDPQRWSFLTGALIDVDALTEQFGMYFSREGNAPIWDHNLRTVVVGPDLKIRKIFIGNAWKPEELAAALTEAAGAPPG